MKNIIVIKGGSTYADEESYVNKLKEIDLKLERIKPFIDWKHNIKSKLGENYEVYLPIMPCSENANYFIWKIMFEKVLEKMNDEIILVGHSLGGIFLVKYLSENVVSRKINQLHLVATPFNSDGLSESLYGFEFDENNLKILDEQVDKIFIYQSKDDFAIPFSHAEKYKSILEDSDLLEFEDRGHFIQKEFPELIENIKG